MSDCAINIRVLFWHIQLTTYGKWRFSFNSWVWKNKKLEAFLKPIAVYEDDTMSCGCEITWALGTYKCPHGNVVTTWQNPKPDDTPKVFIDGAPYEPGVQSTAGIKIDTPKARSELTTDEGVNWIASGQHATYNEAPKSDDTPKADEIQDIFRNGVFAECSDADKVEAYVKQLQSELAALKTELKILKNPSDGRCMEIGALRSAIDAEKLKVGRLREALENLLTTSMKHSDQHGCPHPQYEEHWKAWQAFMDAHYEAETALSETE